MIELARELRLKPVYVLGHLHVLWHSVLEQQEDGDLSSWSDDLIAEMSCYEGDSARYVSLLQTQGWLDGKIIHDWLDYAGKYLTAKYRTANPGKLKRILGRHKSVNSRSKVGRSPIRLSRSSKVGSGEGESEGENWGSPRALIVLYNEKAPDEWAAVEQISDARIAKAKKYLAQFPKKEFWEEVFAEIHKSQWLRGLSHSNGREAFRNRNLDWLMSKGKGDQVENCVKVSEGRYRE